MTTLKYNFDTKQYEPLRPAQSHLDNRSVLSRILEFLFGGARVPTTCPTCGAAPSKVRGSTTLEEVTE